jgi:hypothetical protein
MIVDWVIERLANEVDAFAGRVQDVADLAEMIAAGKIPQTTPAAWVMHQGDDAPSAQFMTGLVAQPVAETISVVICQRVAGDRTGAKARALIVPIRDAVIAALVGQEPDGADDMILYRRGRMIGIEGATLFYQMDFLCGRQIRQPS